MRRVAWLVAINWSSVGRFHLARCLIKTRPSPVVCTSCGRHRCSRRWFRSRCVHVACLSNHHVHVLLPRIKPRPHQQRLSKQHCRILQVERFFRSSRTLLRHCCWYGWGFIVPRAVYDIIRRGPQFRVVLFHFFWKRGPHDSAAMLDWLVIQNSHPSAIGDYIKHRVLGF